MDNKSHKEKFKFNLRWKLTWIILWKTSFKAIVFQTFLKLASSLLVVALDTLWVLGWMSWRGSSMLLPIFSSTCLDCNDQEKTSDLELTHSPSPSFCYRHQDDSLTMVFSGTLEETWKHSQNLNHYVWEPNEG